MRVNGWYMHSFSTLQGIYRYTCICPMHFILLLNLAPYPLKLGKMSLSLSKRLGGRRALMLRCTINVVCLASRMHMVSHRRVVTFKFKSLFFQFCFLIMDLFGEGFSKPHPKSSSSDKVVYNQEVVYVAPCPTSQVDKPAFPLAPGW